MPGSGEPGSQPTRSVSCSVWVRLERALDRVLRDVTLEDLVCAELNPRPGAALEVAPAEALRQEDGRDS